MSGFAMNFTVIENTVTMVFRTLRHTAIWISICWIALSTDVLAQTNTSPETAKPFNVRIEIDMRAEIAAKRFDPTKDSVGLRGASPPLSWNETMRAAATGDDKYVLELTFSRATTTTQPLQYKFKIDSPSRELSDGWESDRNRVFVFHSANQTVSRAFNSPPENIVLQRTGRIDRITTGSWPASKFVEPREVQIWLPPGYENEGSRRYPVLYLHDGQNVFDADASGAEWQFDETTQRLVQSGAIAPIIIVAVNNISARRHEYAPTSVLQPNAPLNERHVGGGAVKYARFLVEELKPMIDTRYRTQRDAKHTAVGGSSLGGLLSMWLLLHHGDVFGAGLVVSPSIWWDSQFIVRDIAVAALGAKERPKIWLDMGGRESSRALNDARQLRDALHKRGWNQATLAYLEQMEGTHDEASWAMRVEPMLRFLYGTPVINR
jgi:predicted alpha/beta superfamily hydrolase